MRRYFLLLVFLIPWLCTPPAVAQDSSFIDLRGKAAFRPGDDDVWRSKYIDEIEEWNFIPVPGAWEANGFPLLDGFAWYRVRFRVPHAMRGDSLLLVMSAVDDADETFLNGVLVGKSGAFPPNVRSELRSLRVYPLPRFIREEHNLLAVRVFDKGDDGGITGAIFRIIRAEDIGKVLDEIVDTPAEAASLYISNGVMVSAISADSGIVRWSRPRLYDRISQDLLTENTLSQLQLTSGEDGRPLPPPTGIGFIPGTGILHATFPGDLEVYWYHPRDMEQRVLVTAIRAPASTPRESGIGFTFDRPAWMYRALTTEDPGMRTTYHILVYNSCCMELAERDIDQVMDQGEAVFGLDAEIARWRSLHREARYIPGLLDAKEHAVYSQSLISLLQATVREPGGGFGQILSGLEPRSRAVCIPADHLLAVRALAAAGLGSVAHDALRFVHNAEHAQYTLFDVYGNERGVGYPYLVPPVPWDGSGNEWRWPRADQATLRFDGPAWYIEAVDALREHERNRVITSGARFDDSAWVAPWWQQLSTQVADILTYRLDSTGLLKQDDSPWGSGLSELPSVHGSVRAIHALGIAARFAEWMRDDLKAFLYRDAARRCRDGVLALLRRVVTSDKADALDARALRVFHPLLCDAVALGIFEAASEETAFILDMVETSFSVEGEALHYHARPDGDWFERQVRPQIALRLCRAYAAAGKHERAEALFAKVTSIAAAHGNMLPELYDPVTGKFYGAQPSIATAADYILTAERILLSRMNSQQR
ncbi:MAG: hypothetical protein M5R41_02055 [Bacteroidia bacterium]|nr:hypothetical protein [Bacteroidia bacterium]